MKDYLEVLEEIVSVTGTPQSRILCLDSSVGLKFPSWQTIIVEKVEAKKRLRGEEKAKSVAASSEGHISLAQEDMSLVAVADIVNELCETLPDVGVPEYLQTEPLIEKVRIPGHGEALFLPNENCDHIEQVVI